MRDLLPDEMERVRGIEDAFAATCRSWGYREVRTPAIEPLHLFTAAGTLSPQTLDRVYSFLDWDGWSGERVVLRPDSTIPTARLYAEHLDAARIAKLFYAQSVFRFTDDGSDREEAQCGVELIGDTGVRGDLELTLLALEVVKKCSIQAPAVSLSHAGIVRAVLGAAGLTQEQQASAYDRLLDGDMSVVDDVEARLPHLNAPLRMLFEIDGAGNAYIANLRAPLVSAIPDLARPFDELEFVVAALEAKGIAPQIKAVLARNFEYYSGLVFRIDAGGRRLVAGGRYDELVGLIGGDRVPASGFALYVMPAAHATTALDAPRPLTVSLRSDGGVPLNLPEIYQVAEALRDAGLTVHTVDGVDSGSAIKMTLGAQSPRFALSGAVTGAFDDVASVLTALGRSR